MSTREPQPSEKAGTVSRSQTSSSTPAKPKKKRTLPDWKPLGTIRDSFYEQMKQDRY
ncbi:MAG TPA: hypothetical protein V6C99_02510 [Oculatellaceae cyanobacterium]|jgi:hypothetical protein